MKRGDVGAPVRGDYFTEVIGSVGVGSGATEHRTELTRARQIADVLGPSTKIAGGWVVEYPSWTGQPSQGGQRCIRKALIALGQQSGVWVRVR